MAGLVVVVVCLLGQGESAPFEGNGPFCVQENANSSVFEVSSGDFDPSSSPENLLDNCGYQCGFLGFTHVGVDEAANCFCSSTLEGKMLFTVNSGGPFFFFQIWSN